MSVVVVAPGMPLAEVVRRSTIEIGVLRQPDGWAVAQPHGPHTVLVEHDVHGFVLAEGPFTVIEAVDDRVARFVASPQLEPLGFEQAWDNARTLAAALHEAQWHARVRFAHEESVRSDIDTLLGRWTAIDWRLELLLRPVDPAAATIDDAARRAASWFLSVRLEGGSR